MQELEQVLSLNQCDLTDPGSIVNQIIFFLQYHISFSHTLYTLPFQLFYSELLFKCRPLSLEAALLLSMLVLPMLSGSMLVLPILSGSVLVLPMLSGSMLVLPILSGSMLVLPILSGSILVIPILSQGVC